jgi:hypothetical protein
VLNSRQTDIQTVQTMDDQKYLHVVSSALCNGLHINTLISRCRETWAGAAGACGGGHGCGPAASIGPLRK